MRFGYRYDELDAATDVGKDEFPRSYHETVVLMAMTDATISSRPVKHKPTLIRTTTFRRKTVTAEEHE